MAANEPSRPSGRIESVDGARGIAALLVLFLHASDYTAVPQYFDYLPLGGAFGWGWAGVDFFFVLSGFIIAYSAAPLVGRRDGLRHYLVQRFTRVYPIYWVVTLAMLAGFVFLPVSRVGFETEPGTLFTSFTLLPSGSQVIVPVAWTLVYEVLFYLVYALVVVRPAAGFTVLVAWQAATIGWNVLDLGHGAAADYLFTLRYINFGLGVAAGHFFLRRRVPVPGVLALGGTLLFVAAGFVTVWPPGASPDLRKIQLVLAVGSTLILLGLAEGERSRAWRTPAALAFLGAASYSIYLLHSPAQLVLVKALRAFDATAALPPLVIFALLAAGGVACGAVLHLTVERPLLGWSRRLLRPRRTVPAIA